MFCDLCELKEIAFKSSNVSDVRNLKLLFKDVFLNDKRWNKNQKNYIARKPVPILFIRNSKLVLQVPFQSWFGQIQRGLLLLILNRT